MHSDPHGILTYVGTIPKTNIFDSIDSENGDKSSIIVEQALEQFKEINGHGLHEEDPEWD